MRCVSVSREKEDLGFTNTCNMQIFVVWCGNLKYSKKQWQRKKPHRAAFFCS